MISREKVIQYADEVSRALTAIDAALGGVGVVHDAASAAELVIAALGGLGDVLDGKAITAGQRDAAIEALRAKLDGNDRKADAALEHRFDGSERGKK